MLKNYNKDGQKLPLFVIGPYMILGMGVVNLITIWCMLLGSILCFIFAELIYKTYR